MALTSLMRTFRLGYGLNQSAIAGDLNTFFSANPNIIIKALDSNKSLSTYANDDLKIRLAYQAVSVENTGISYQADVYTTDASGTAQDNFNTDHSVNDVCLVPLFVLDITDHEESRTSQQQLLVISGDTSAAGAGTLFAIDRGVFVAQPLLDITAGSTGNAVIYNACGDIVSASFPVTNVDPATTWQADERNYIVFDPVTGELIGLPSCCGNTPLGTPIDPTTTTTDVCVTVEVQSFTPVSFTSSTTSPPLS